MNFALSIIGIVGALVLIGAGFGYVFNPAAARKCIKTAGMWLGTLVGCLIAASELTRVHPFGVLLAVLMVSPVAYLVRERRRRRSERPRKTGAMERTPVAPRQVREDDL
jgi:hypothetical protein